MQPGERYISRVRSVAQQPIQDIFSLELVNVQRCVCITPGQLGDVITSSNTINGGVFTRTITGLDLPSNVDNINNLKLIAFVRNTYTKTFVDYFGDTHTNSPHYDIYNVQEVHVGESQAFD